MKKITNLLLLSMMVLLTSIGSVFAQEIKDAPNPLNMEKGTHIYRVGDDGIEFYDDGGKAGKHSVTTTEEPIADTVTFVPQDASKKVLINFSEIDLFWSDYAKKVENTSDLLIYNGKKATGTPLLFVKDMKKAIALSQSEDGALTVVFKRKYIARDGWKSVVKQVALDQPMVLQSVTLNQKGLKKSLNIGTQNAFALRVNFETEGFAAINLSEITFTATNPCIDKATLMTAGSDGDLKVAKEIISIDANGKKEFKFENLKNLPLKMGSNYFILLVDIKKNVEDNTKVAFNLSDFKIGSFSYQQAKADGKIGAFTPDETIIKKQGVFTIGHQVFDLDEKGLKLESQPWSESIDYKYLGDAGDRIITLKVDKDKVVEAKFTDFNIAFANFAPEQPSFTVYDGEEANGAPIVSIKNPEDQKLWDGKVFRSTTRAMTIKFTTIGETTQKLAFHGFAKAFKPSAMAPDKAIIKPASLEIVSPGQENAEILNTELTVKGNLLPISLDSFTVDLRGSAALIGKVSIYKADENYKFEASDLIAAKEVAENAQEITFNAQDLDKLPQLKEFGNYIVITADVKETAAVDSEIKLGIKKISSNGKDFTLEGQAPEKGRKVLNILLQPATGSVVKKVVSPLYYYDEAGKDGKIVKGSESTVTFLPGKDGESVRLHIVSMNMSTNTFNVYTGTKAEGKTLFEGKYKTINADKPADDILSTSKDGALTVYFKGINKYADGWEILVESVVPQDRQVTKVAAESTKVKEVLKGGSADMLKIGADVKGDKNGASLDKMVFEVSENISSGSIFFTGLSDNFATSELVAQAKAENKKITFDTSSKKIEKNGTNFFWFVAEAAPTAEAGQDVTAKLISVEPNIKDFTPAEATIKVKKGISGNFIIGASEKADFKNIQSAFESLKGGIDGPVVFQIEDGEYDSENALLPEVPGASKNNTITLTSMSNDRKKVTIIGKKSNNTGYSSPKQGTITIDGTDYLTIKNLTFKTDDISYAANILIQNASNNVTIDSCDIITKKTTDYRNSIRGIQLYAKDSYLTNSNNFTLTNSNIEGGNVGIEIAGIGYIAEPTARGALIKNNVISGAESKLIYVNRYADFVFEGNKLNMNNAAGSTIETIAIIRGSGESKIEGNEITIDGLERYGVACEFRGFNEEALAEPHLLVANNIFRMKDVKGSSYVMEFGNKSDNSNIDIFYNTVIIDGQDAQNSAVANILAGDRLDNVHFANNIFINKAKGYVYRMHGKKFSEHVSFNNNAIFADEIIYNNPHNENEEDQTGGFDKWIKLSGEKDSKVVDIKFASDALLLPIKLEDVNFAKPEAQVKTDITGKERNAEHPCVGAYEAIGNYSEEAPKLVKYEVKSIKGTEATIAIEADQLSTFYYKVVLKDADKPSAEEILKNGKNASLQEKKETSFTISGLDVDTEYVIYGVAVGAINQKQTIAEGLPFTTGANPVVPSTFDDPKQIEEVEGGFISGSNKFEGFEIVKDPNGTDWDTNMVAKMKGQSATIYVINTKKAIVQPGFFMMNDKKATVTAIREDNMKAENVIEVEPSDHEFYYIKSRELGEVRAIKIESEGNVWIDSYNGDPKPMVLTAKDGGAIKGQKATVSVNVSEGVAPYTFEWDNGEKGQSAQVVADKTKKVNVTVTDALGSKAKTFAYVIAVDGEDQFKTATFEDLEVPEAKFVNNARFVSEQYLFNNSYNPAYGSWSGFAYTNSKDSTFTSYSNGTDQYNVVAKGGYKSDNYAVGYYSSFTGAATIKVAAGDMGAQIKGTMLALTSWTYSFFINGDKGQKQEPVKDGDFFVVTFTGDNGKTVSDSLVNYTGGNKIIEKNWKWVDLSKLGKVKTISISTKGSRKNNYGDVVPSYFAIDNFNCEKPKNVSAEVPFSSQVRAYLADGKIFVKDAEGYTIKLHAMDGSLVNEFVAASDDEVRSISIPEGTYIMVAFKGHDIVRTKLIMK